MEIHERFAELDQTLAPLNAAKGQLDAVEAQLSGCLDQAQALEDRKTELIELIADLREKALSVAKAMVADLSAQPAVVPMKKKKAE